MQAKLNQNIYPTWNFQVLTKFQRNISGSESTLKDLPMKLFEKLPTASAELEYKTSTGVLWHLFTGLSIARINQTASIYFFAIQRRWPEFDE